MKDQIQEQAERFAQLLDAARAHGLTWQEALFAVGLAINGTAKAIAKLDGANKDEVLASGRPALEQGLALRFIDDDLPH